MERLTTNSKSLIGGMSHNHLAFLRQKLKMFSYDLQIREGPTEIHKGDRTAFVQLYKEKLENNTKL